MEPDDLLCSHNARPQKALVGHAQWKIIQSPSLRENERAWREHLDQWSPGTRARLGALGVGRVKMVRAVKGGIGHSS